MLSTTLTSQEIDDVLAGSFPASDPPAWTPGIARPAPASSARAAVTGTADNDTKDVHAGDLIDVSQSSVRGSKSAKPVVAVIR
jgi:hypothetical protein